jgi:glycosyltransferase involved in cell wall biosynthesis
MHGLAIHERSNPILIKMVALIERFAATCCDRVITVSSFHRRWSLALNIASPSKITAIPNGVPCTETDGEYASTLREVMGASGPDHFVLLYSGRLAPGKGLETLLRAMPLIIDRLGERVRCVFVGEGPIRSALERLSRRLGVASQVIFLGFRHDVGDLLRASDAFILASEREGMSISLLEAMAAGKPIIATDIASNREATDNGEAARLVRVGHSGDIADAVVTLANDRDLCLNIGSRARELWRERYTLPSAIASLQSLYREALANRHTTVSTSIGATRHAAKPSPKTSALLD